MNMRPWAMDSDMGTSVAVAVATNRATTMAIATNSIMGTASDSILAEATAMASIMALALT